MTQAWNVTFEPTPNPQSLKFLAGAKIAGESVAFRSAGEAQLRSPLARKIFGFPWADGVLIGPDFVTVTKQDWVDWEALAEPLAGLIAEHLERGEPVLFAALAQASPAAPPEASGGAGGLDGASEARGSSFLPSDSAEVRLIKQIIDSEIRPAVALDGGDIAFERFEENVVYLYMRGACSGCPNSAMTLKQGIEARLRNAIPAIREVVAL
jgi:Fe-S cluster biogenesis protein NfuA